MGWRINHWEYGRLIETAKPEGVVYTPRTALRSCNIPYLQEWKEEIHNPWLVIYRNPENYAEYWEAVDSDGLGHVAYSYLAPGQMEKVLPRKGPKPKGCLFEYALDRDFWRRRDMDRTIRRKYLASFFVRKGLLVPEIFQHPGNYKHVDPAYPPLEKVYVDLEETGGY
jgi:hypothetical protein